MFRPDLDLGIAIKALQQKSLVETLAEFGPPSDSILADNSATTWVLILPSRSDTIAFVFLPIGFC
jgi:hypothetical protein